MNYDRPELLDRLAAEYVLGTLRGRARRRFEQLLMTLPAARVSVDEWNSRLARLAEPVPAIVPPPRVWAAIAARTSARTAARSADAARETARQSRWATFWKPAFGFAFGVALTVGLVQIHPSGLVSLDDLANESQALPQSYVGLLTDRNNQPTLLVSSTRQGTRVTVKFLRPVATPAGKVIQVWALPREGAPFPLGVATSASPPGSTTFDMSGSSDKLLATVPRLAVSFEDAPAGARSTPGEFVLVGFCVKLW